MRESWDWIIRERKYWKPQSLTWWCGFVLVVSGVLQANALEIPYVSPLARPLIDAAFPGASHGAMITIGLGYIGLRGKDG